MELQMTPQGEPGTNCLECERYKTLGEVCVVEHGKKFLWEFCRDFQAEVKLPEYDDLMRTVKKEMAIQREKARAKKKRELALRRKEIEEKHASKKVRLSKRVVREKSLAIPPVKVRASSLLTDIRKASKRGMKKGKLPRDLRRRTKAEEPTEAGKHKKTGISPQNRPKISNLSENPAHNNSKKETRHRKLAPGSSEIPAEKLADFQAILGV